MAGRESRRPPKVLRRIAMLLMRGPEAQFVLDDLDELLERDLAAGMTPRRAGWRYGKNVLASWFAVRRARLRRPRLPGVSWLDVKLGVRLLARQPVLTLVAVCALAIGIPVGLAPLQLLDALNSRPPFHEGDRILGIRNHDVVVGHSKWPSLHDFDTWRSELTSFEQLGAYRSVLQNLVGADGQAAPVQGSSITASAFGILRVNPLHGRILLESDERRGADPVVVLGYDLWQSRFGGDIDIVGRTVRLGGVARQVVGVMPSGFAFPHRGDKFWVTLQARAIDYERGEAPMLVVFGRLGQGVSARQAQAEVAAIGLRTATDYPETHAYLSPKVMPLTQAVTGLEPTPGIIFTMELVALLLLAVTCGNVGTLMLARSATRSSEIAVRTALGASRGRIVAQLFVESLVLAALAAAVGLGLGELLVRKTEIVWSSPWMPSWVDFGLTTTTALMASVVTLFSAVIAGMLPAIKATGKGVQRSLQRAATGASGLRFGAGATALIVAEVALAVGFLSVVGTMARNVIRSPESNVGITAQEYLSAQLGLPAEPGTSASAADEGGNAMSRFAQIQEEVAQRLEAEPEVNGVAFASTLPGMDHAEGRIQVEGQDSLSMAHRPHEVRTAAVDVGYFAGLGEPTLNGRDFHAGDVESGSNVVIVNQSFVDKVLRGRSAIGQRVRYVRYPGQAEPERDWYEIVGVVRDLGMNVANRDGTAGIYRPIATGGIQPTWIAVRLTTAPALFVQKLRAIVAAIDPAVIVSDARPLDDVSSGRLTEARFKSFAFAGLAFVAVLLSLAGLYALMSFTVSERTYEIAIRTALGARPQRVAAGVLARALIQLGMGVALGLALGAFLISEFAVHASVVDQWPFVVAAMALVMTAVGLLACAGPTLRALRIEPIDALKEPG